MAEPRPSRPPLERPTAEPPAPKPTGSLVPLVTVVGTLLTFVLGIIMLAGQAGVYMLIAIAALAALPLLHYVTWGWWLSKSVESERAAQRENEKQER